MAKRTGTTIADAMSVESSPRAPRVRRAVRFLGALVVVSGLVLGPHLSIVFAAQPGSRVQSGQASSTQANTAKKPGSSGFFGLRSVFGKKPTTGSRGKLPDRLADLPLDRLTPEARSKILAVASKPTLYRELPTQSIGCDQDLFLFLTRKPEAIIGIWDLMGITSVKAQRTGPYHMDAVDGSGTTCRIDLLYGDPNLHIYFADGMYDGKFAQKPIKGKGVFVFRSSYARAADGSTTVNGTLECYVKFESLGADLIARSLGGLIGKSADHNFVETAKFLGQVSRACETNPNGMLEMADRLPQVDGQTKAQFARVISTVSRRSLARNQRPSLDRSAQLVRPTGIRESK